jgi:NADH-quinone oxidoreductase subunit L
MDQILIIWLFLVPLLGAVLTYKIGSLKPALAGPIATLASLTSFLITVQLVLQLEASQAALTFSSLPWIELGTLKIDWAFTFDKLTAVMSLLVTGVGTLIHLYSCAYMHEDSSRPRFFAYLNLFLASMLILIVGANLPVLFIGWEGVGLCSYLLIGFWFTNPDYNKAAQKAFVMNRIGDLGLLVAMFLAFYNTNSLDFTVINKVVLAGGLSESILVFLGLGLLLAAIGKSAQLPLFTWLPDAMAGPTPVSALIHAATMVTAGIYLIARFNPIFSAVPELQYIIAIIACITAFMAATTALVQNDIKKVLAYSTVSQLGFMFAALASGIYWLAIFHVLTHGFFKACLFLCAGSVIHSCHHQQDMRKMGGLRKLMPLTFLSFTFATLAIAGIAPFAGYYSKHLIIEAFSAYSATAASNYWISPSMLGALLGVTSLLTAFYMGRCWIMTFFGEYKGEDKSKLPHEAPWAMTLPVSILGVCSIVAGYILILILPEYLSSLSTGARATNFNTTLSAPVISSDLLHSIPAVLALVLSYLVFSVFKSRTAQIVAAFTVLKDLFAKSYYLDQIYEVLIVRPLRFISWILWKFIDELLIASIEGLGILGVKISSRLMGVMQNGHVRVYASFLVLGMLGLMLLLVRGF